MIKKAKIILLILGIAAAIAVIPVFWLFYNPSGDLEVDFLNVGQGDAILIKTPFGQNILIDGGPDNAVLSELAKNLPWWDRRIDLMILTHPHDDHVAGLIDVMKRYNVKKILYTGVVHSAPNYLAWLELIKENKVPLVIIDRPQTVKLGEDCELRIIYPRLSLLGKAVDNLNNSSLVIKLIYGRTGFLLTGDIETEVERELVKSGADLSADVLKVSHHGSDASNSQEFLEKVKAKIAVIQVGKDNDFGHPSLRVIKRLEKTGARVFRTDLDGTVKIISDGENIK
ncbi:MBL fold metallo-hydrolase [Patescibacteria group bacterium]|nr:MBL fold metallo-hydrolase [Patescibacteria group bacterium]MBU4454918.1 MBL fold metallo-hydrolase [Patescibacteria group bacterium]